MSALRSLRWWSNSLPADISTFSPRSELVIIYIIIDPFRLGCQSLPPGEDLDVARYSSDDGVQCGQDWPPQILLGSQD